MYFIVGLHDSMDYTNTMMLIQFTSCILLIIEVKER